MRPSELNGCAAGANPSIQEGLSTTIGGQRCPSTTSRRASPDLQLDDPAAHPNRDRRRAIGRPSFSMMCLM